MIKKKLYYMEFFYIYFRLINILKRIRIKETDISPNRSSFHRHCKFGSYKCLNL